MLIDQFGEEICFTYPKDFRKSQMLFSTKIKTADIAETLRVIDPTKSCPETLREKSCNFDFGLRNSYHSADNISVSYSQFIKSRPAGWETFFNTISPYMQKPDNVTRKTDVIFQFFFNVIHNGHLKTPIHIKLCETLHDACRSKKLIEVLNRTGLCMSYKQLERIDLALAQRVIAAAQSHHTPMPPINEVSK